MEEETCYRCHNLRPLIRLAIEEGQLLFFWENTMADSRWHVGKGKVSSLSTVEGGIAPEAALRD